jgi:protein gp37
VVSFEPLIEPIGDVALDHIDWFVGGGESGPDDVRRAYEL